jgi:hypothetical protein
LGVGRSVTQHCRTRLSALAGGGIGSEAASKLAQRRAQGIKPRSMREFIFVDEAAERRGDSGELIGGEVKRRRGSGPPAACGR